MSRILLLRHAKSSWTEPGMRDFDRPLARRGISDADKMGAVMRAAGYHPDLVICSAARRTRETWAGISPHIDVPEDRLIFTKTLYDSSVAGYVDAARSAVDAESVLIIGHNPMIEDTAAALVAGGSDSAMRRLAKGVPTSGLAIIKFDCGLQDLALSSGYLEAFLRPSNMSQSDDGL